MRERTELFETRAKAVKWHLALTHPALLVRLRVDDAWKAALSAWGRLRAPLAGSEYVVRGVRQAHRDRAGCRRL